MAPLARLVPPAPADRLQLYPQPCWGRRGAGHFWSTQAVSVDMCIERNPTNHAQFQQTRQAKQQPDSSLEISFLPSLSHLQATEQRQASTFDTTGHENTWHTLSDLERYFFSFYKEATDVASKGKACPDPEVCTGPLFTPDQRKPWGTAGENKKVIGLWGHPCLADALL